MEVKLLSIDTTGPCVFLHGEIRNKTVAPSSGKLYVLFSGEAGDAVFKTRFYRNFTEEREDVHEWSCIIFKDKLAKGSYGVFVVVKGELGWYKVGLEKMVVK